MGKRAGRPFDGVRGEETNQLQSKEAGGEGWTHRPSTGNSIQRVLEKHG